MESSRYELYVISFEKEKARDSSQKRVSSWVGVESSMSLIRGWPKGCGRGHRAQQAAPLQREEMAVSTISCAFRKGTGPSIPSPLLRMKLRPYKERDGDDRRISWTARRRKSRQRVADERCTGRSKLRPYKEKKGDERHISRR
jgi:hypothetical protein